MFQTTIRRIEMGPIIMAAIAHNNVIGSNGKMPWGHIKRDMAYFQRVTLGHRVVMGFDAFVSIGKPLPNRINLVMTNYPEKLARFNGSIGFVDSVDSVIKIAETKELYVLGGGRVYQQFIERQEVRIMYITRIIGSFSGDTYFPEFSADDWQMTRCEAHGVSEINKYPIVFETWIRK